MRCRIDTLTLLLGCLTALVACGPDAAMRKGDKYYVMGEYFDAAAQYKKAYAQTPSKERALRGQRALRLADCYRRINYSQRSIAAYNNAVRYHQERPQDLYYLALQQLKNGAYKAAEKNLRQVMDSLEAGAVDSKPRGDSLSSEQLRSLVRNGLETAITAAGQKALGSKYTVKRQDLFNSRRSEYSPALAGD